MPVTTCSHSFLSDVRVYDVDVSGHLIDPVGLPTESLATRAIESGCAEVTTDSSVMSDDSSSAIAIPVFRDQRVVSVAVLSARTLNDERDDVVGVFEVWEPVGVYEELGLKAGYYGRMERFRTVSSFVRFEKGNGLPGQVWQQCCGVIHDDLSNHPGFLRAAGASADLLRTAIGIPVAAQRYHSTAVLISSAVSPMAKAMEVWQTEDDGFALLGGAYDSEETAERLALHSNAKLDLLSGLPGLANQANGAVLSDDVDRLMAGRSRLDNESPTAGLAIPFFCGDVMTSVTTLLF